MERINDWRGPVEVEGCMKKGKKRSIGRRDMFRMMGAGGAAALSSGLATAAIGPQDDPTRQAIETAWNEVNEMDRQRSRLWQQRMDWWLDARFGMFIHWDPSSLASVEISWPIMAPSPKW